MNALPAIAADELRDVMACFATGVAVVTAAHPDGPVGMVVNSFVSVSLDPPLVLFCAAHTSSTWPVIRATGHFCANVLAAHQEELARRFARRCDRFAGVAYTSGRTGAPVLREVHAHIECKIVETYEAGDHTLVLGRVVDLAANTDVSPLLFYRSAYRLI